MDIVGIVGPSLRIPLDAVAYSPLLSTMKDTTVPMTRVRGAYQLPFPYHLIYQYMTFLLTGQINMSEEFAGMLDYMGHMNHLEYPLDYWAIKLQDNWIRDHMYSKKLYEDPFYGLIDVPIIPDRLLPFIPLPTGVYIAGGYAMYLAGWTDTFHDVDIFVTRKEVLDELLKGMISNGDFLANVGTNTISMPIKHILRAGWNGSPATASVQVILRLYTAPTEIVHGFDLDCCGILWDPTEPTILSATKRAIFAYQKMTNWLDPARASPSYAYRLSKYSLRGYEIMLPLFNDIGLLHRRVQDMFEHIYDIYAQHVVYSHVQESAIIMKANTYEENPADVAIHMIVAARHIHKATTVLGLAWRAMPLEHINAYLLFLRDWHGQDLNTPQGMAAAIRRFSIEGDEILKKIIPRDPVSILILAKFYHFVSSASNPSTDVDYEDWTNRDTMASTVDTSNLSWKEIDPMSQLTGTFQPSPILNMREWYFSSPLTNPNLSMS